MGDAARFALAILILFLAMLAFFIAFHPNAVSSIDGLTKDSYNPVDEVAQFLTNEFDKGTATPGSGGGNVGAK